LTQDIGPIHDKKEKITHLGAFLTDINQIDDHFLYDPMARDKLQAFDSYTFAASSQSFRSILDNIFTTFPTVHCEKSQILDWEAYKDVGLSDHRAVVTQISLSSLCDGWIEYPSCPPRLTTKINLESVSDEHIRRLRRSIQDWRSSLPHEIAEHLLHDTNNEEAKHVESELLQKMHSHLIDLFVDQPARALNSGKYHRHKTYKTPDAGYAQHVLVWLHRYKCALRHLLDAKQHGRSKLEKNIRRQTRRTYLDFQNEVRLQINIPEIPVLLTRDFARWTLEEWLHHWNTASQLHSKWKTDFDSHLRLSKQKGREKLKAKVFSTPIGSKARRAHQLIHKNATMSLPAVMKDPQNPLKMITGHAVNETWGSSATATRPNTMPLKSTEPGMHPTCNGWTS
jgi:hypothetical protein